MRHYVKLFLTSSLVLVAIASATVAGSLEDATTAYQRGDYETARRLLRPLAEQGDAAAQSKLGEMYAAGDGVRQDYAEAAKLYQLAAEQGEPDAQELLRPPLRCGRGRTVRLRASAHVARPCSVPIFALGNNET